MKITSETIVLLDKPNWSAAETRLASFAAEDLVDSSILENCYELTPSSYLKEGRVEDSSSVGEEIREILHNDICLLKKAYEGEDVPWIDKSDSKWVCSGPEFPEDSEDSIGSSPFYAVARLYESGLLDDIGFQVV